MDTIRRDLRQLETRRLIQRTHGGALRQPGVLLDPSVDRREEVLLEEKRAIGYTAASLVDDHDAIIIDAGTTTAQMARELRDASGITVITNAVNIMTILINNLRVDSLIMTGGEFRRGIFSLVGPETEEQLQRYRVDKLFLAVSGVSFDFGITTPNRIEAQAKMKMIEAARQVVLLADHSKFGQVSLVSIAPLRRIHTIVTDWGIQSETVCQLKDMGVDVVVADRLKKPGGR